MIFKGLFGNGDKKNKTASSSIYYDIYKEQQEENNHMQSPLMNKVEIKDNYNMQELKINIDLPFMSTPIIDYNYKEIGLTLYDQRDFYDRERENLQKIISHIDYLKKYHMKVSKLSPFAKSARLPQLEKYKLNVIIPVLKNDLGMFLSEYDNAFNKASKGSYNAKIGLEGESNVDKELDLYRDKLLNMPNVRLQIEGTTVESDNIVISENGVFCIEVKNFGFGHGGLVKVTKDGKWVRYSAEREPMEVENITAQTYRHIGITQRLVNEELKRKGIKSYINFNPIIVFANNQIKIVNESDIPILRISNIYHYISTFNLQDKLDQKYWGLIENILNSYNKGSKAYSVKLCSSKLIQNYNLISKKIQFIENLDKQIPLEKVLQEESLEENKNLISSLSKYNNENKERKIINHVETVSIRALIDELDSMGEDRNIIEGIILRQFNVSNLNQLSKNEYEFIYSCLNQEVRRKY